MILLHGSLLDGRLMLWGERTSSAAEVRPPLRHSLDAGPDHLRAALADACPKALHGHALFEPTAWLPTLGGLPLSSTLLTEEATREDGQETELRPWIVTAAALVPLPAIDLLGACRGRRALAPGLVVAPDLAFLDHVLRFALELVARQRFLPGLVAGRACWTPVVTGPDAERLAALVGVMPGACRALVRGEEDRVRPVAHDVAAFVEAVVDAVVRDAAARSTQEAQQGASDHDAWLHALLDASNEGVIAATPAAIEKVAGEVDAWRHPLVAGAPPPFRFCFRLEEPGALGEVEAGGGGALADRARFEVRYLIQSAADPSLLLPLDEATAAGAEATVALIARGPFDVPAFARRSLERAARVCPAIEAALEAAQPIAGHELGPAGALEFLERRAWALEQAGFTVLVPSWWTRGDAAPRLRMRARATPRVVGAVLSLESLFDVDWEVVLDGDGLPGALRGLPLPSHTINIDRRAGVRHLDGWNCRLRVGGTS